jgi:L-ectoine synthase
MIIRTLDEIIDTERDVAWGNGQSRRFLLEKDGMGYSLTDTIVEAGTSSLLEYKSHWEACYCISGEGTIEADGVVHLIQPGTMYALDRHEKHYLIAKTTLRLICVFTPPLQGKEAHNLNLDQSSCY